MRLISLELENFRQHSSTKIDFVDGITIINGVNGSGKSTILEAISWAIYGTEAARGNKDSIKWNKAPARSKVKAELVFALENEVFRVVRELNKAEVYLNGKDSPLAVTQDEVTKYLIDKLGMNKSEFFNTYFTGQKELDFLGNQKPIERRRFISKVLSYDKVREAQEQVRVDKNNISNEILGMKQGLADIESLEEEKKLANEKSTLVQNLYDNKQKELNLFAQELGKLHPDWSKIKTQKEEYNKLSVEFKFASSKIEDLDKNIILLTDEFKKLEEKSLKLNELEKEALRYKEIESKIQEQEKLQKYEIEKQKLTVKFESFNMEVINLEKKLSEITISDNQDNSKKIDMLKFEIEKIKNDSQKNWTEWTGKKQEIKALIKQKEQEISKIANQFSIIEQKGQNGTCPTCTRPLKDEYENVINNFQSQLESLGLEMQELFKQEELLESEPLIISDLKKSLELKEKEHEELTKILAKILEESKTADNIRKDILSKKELKDQTEKLIEQIPKGFNEELFQKLKTEYYELKKVYEETLGLKAQLANKDKIKTNLEEYSKNKVDQEHKKKEIETVLKQINFSEETYKTLEEQVINAEKSFNNAKIEAAQAEGEVKQIKAILDRIIKQEEFNKEKLHIIKVKQEEFNYLSELDRFFGQFIEKLNDIARPEISEIASEFLSELTDGRYSILELNEKYDICLYDDGEIKPVISGGEEDISNLCIRLAISKMIAQRSGKGLSLLILDEVFGSLDENRRNNVITLLNSLTNNFDQIILITHIDDIKEGVDNVITVEYDEEISCSKILQEYLSSKDLEIEAEQLL